MPRHRTRPPYRSGARRSEEGSAYVISLLVLVLVTLLGLSLVFATQTEMIIGANERLATKVFYETESAVALTAARILIKDARTDFTVEYDRDPDLSTGVPLQRALQASEVLAVQSPYCRLCDAAGTGSYDADSFHMMSYVFTARSALLVPKTASGETPVAAASFEEAEAAAAPRIVTSKTITAGLLTLPTKRPEDGGGLPELPPETGELPPPRLKLSEG